MASSSKRIARSVSSRRNAAEPVPHNDGTPKWRAGDRAQVRNQLVSAAGRVHTGAYPQLQRVDVNVRAPARRRRVLAFQQVEGAADGLAAGRRAGLVGDGGGVREGVPGEGRQVTRCLFGDGDERGQRGGALTRPGQRPPGVAAGGQPQFRVRRDRQSAGGEILHPVPLAGGNSGRRGRDQPARLICPDGAELGRAFHGQRGGGRAAAASRLGRGGLQQRRHLLVRIQRRGGQVPGSPVGLVVQGARRARRCAAARRAKGAEW